MIHPLKALFWVTLVRGVWSIMLGLALISPIGEVEASLLNFMAIYWLVTSVVTIRGSLSGARVGRFTLATGIVGAITGVIVLGRHLLGGTIGQETMLSILGAVICLTGVFHVAHGFLGVEHTRRSWSAIALGAFEIVLGLLVAIAPYSRGTAVAAAASGWAILGGSILILDALRMRREVHHAEPSP
jgi:uncharacterized membrane protein HdeD (DUF308 family)